MITTPTRRALILASASPRRAGLLASGGYDFERVTPPYDDSGHALDGSAEALAATLAERKARSVARRRNRGVVIGCDTLLSIGGAPVGKPADEREARGILERLFDATHAVVSAVCLIDAGDGRRRAFVESTGVHIARPSAQDVEAYLRSGAWRGKAGGYNLEELRDRWRFTLDGDPTTVIGLPMRRLGEELRRFAPDLMPRA